MKKKNVYIQTANRFVNEHDSKTTAEFTHSELLAIVAFADYLDKNALDRDSNDFEKLKKSHAVVNDRNVEMSKDLYNFRKEIKSPVENNGILLNEVKKLETEKAFIKKSADQVSGLLEESENKRCLLADIAKGMIEQIEAQ